MGTALTKCLPPDPNPPKTKSLLERYTPDESMRRLGMETTAGGTADSIELKIGGDNPHSAIEDRDDEPLRGAASPHARAEGSTASVIARSSGSPPPPPIAVDANVSGEKASDATGDELPLPRLDEWSAMGLQERLDDESDPNGSDTCMGSMPSLSSPLSRMSFSDLSAADRFAELRDTEAAYVSDLRTMVSVYARPAQKLAILSREEREAIFCNTEQLLMCNEALLDALRKEGEPEEVWAAAFLSIAPFFKIYASYANNYYTALQTAQDARERSDGFREFLTSQSARAESKNLPLESFLIKPVQRLTKCAALGSSAAARPLNGF